MAAAGLQFFLTEKLRNKKYFCVFVFVFILLFFFKA